MKAFTLRVGVVVSSVGAVVVAQGVQDYVQTYRDFTTVRSISDVIDAQQQGFDEEALVYQLGQVTRYQQALQDDPQAVYILSESKQRLLDALGQLTEQKQTLIDKALGVDEESMQGEISDDQSDIKEDNNPPTQLPSRDPSVVSSIQAFESGETVEVENEDMRDDGDDESDANLSDQASSIPVLSTALDAGLDIQPEQTTVRDTSYDIAYSPDELLAEYQYMIDGEISPLCTVYYDQIDQIAQRNDFPTSLIIAIWYREHSCKFSNPANGRGNFQITSHYYEPGAIVWDEFATQIQNFIDFSRAKRRYYDSIQSFGPEPVSLSYESMDITSIRKHSILYNGVYPDVTLESSWYSNENFTQHRGGRDGIVVTVLKVIQWDEGR